MGLSGDALVLALTVAGAAVALWFLARFPGFGPRTVRTAAVHVLAALACGYLVAPAVQFVAALPIRDADVLALIVGAFPPLVYMLLSIAWLFRAIQRLVGAYS